MITDDTRIIDLTVAQLQSLIGKSIKNNLLEQANTRPHHLQKEFYSPKEFSHLTGIPYSTVVYRCNVGKLKARQDDPNCSWQIDASELDRYTKEANENTF